MKPFTLAEDELYGFTLGGIKDLKTNKITLSYSDRVIDKWPDEIDLFDTTFILDSIVKGGESKTNNTIWEDAHYA